LTADTENYLGLKKIFERKAEQDREEMQRIIAELLTGTQRSISTDDVKLFIEHIFNLHFIAYRYK